MALYEHIYLVRQDVTAPQVEALTEQLKTTDRRATAVRSPRSRRGV